MRSAKSSNSLASQHQQQFQQTASQSATLRNHKQDINGSKSAANNSDPTSPICRCRVMYLGSSVPHITKDGLQGIQEPLSELYPDKASLASGNAGIDSWLSVWSNGILIENVDETGREVKRFFKIDALHYCAAVKFVPQLKPYLNNTSTMTTNGSLVNLPKFLPLDSPHARQTDPSNPPIFACILRRTTGIKVLECHAFICKREAAANALVRCCFHAYADTMYAKQIGADVNTISNDINNKKTIDTQSHASLRQNHDTMDSRQDHQSMISRRSKSIAALNDSDPKRSEAWRMNEVNKTNCLQNAQLHDRNSMRTKNMNDHYNNNNNNCDTNHDNNLMSNDILRKQQKLSKSMHHLNQDNGRDVGLTYDQLIMEQANNHDYDAFPSNQSTSASCINIPNGRWGQQQDPRMMQQVPPQQPFYNPYAGRVPSYPPQNMINAANGGGTLRSIKSMAANSIASTLLRSKKHAKAMSMAQLNQEKITSFHQPHSNVSTMGGPIMMPPVPPMFMPNLPARPIMSGSQTLKAPPMKPMLPVMTPKEMKKLLKKSAKYGIDPNKFGENGLPMLPMRTPPLPPSGHMTPHSKSGTMVSQPMFSDIYGGHDMMPDMAALHGLPPPRGMMMPDISLEHSPMKPILVKPNPEFLKSKAGKKWLKQQKEFKKLLPPHLDGLPIIFGPPPPDALEPATLPPNHIPAPAFAMPPHPGLPVMDSSGFYNPHPFYGQNGRASAASTLLRYSPPSQMMHENGHGYNNVDGDYLQRNHILYSNNMPITSSSLAPRGDFADDSSMITGNNADNVPSRHFADNGHRHQQRRNHMVEQSVISLGDENDLDDDEEEEVEEENDGQQNDYYSVNANGHESNRPLASQTGIKHENGDYHQEKGAYSQQGYEQIHQNNDDQSSYSSGIYKRGHANEIAFSYSIRQELKSNADNEYGSRNDSNYNQQHSANVQQDHQRNQIYHNGQQPVNELTARLENQLNMNTFSNSRIKSHM